MFGAGISFAVLGLLQVLSAVRLPPDHWVIRIQGPGGPFNLLFGSRTGSARRGDPDPNRAVRWSGWFFVALGAGMALASLIT